MGAKPVCQKINIIFFDFIIVLKICTVIFVKLIKKIVKFLERQNCGGKDGSVKIAPWRFDTLLPALLSDVVRFLEGVNGNLVQAPRHDLFEVIQRSRWLPFNSFLFLETKINPAVPHQGYKATGATLPACVWPGTRPRGRQ